MKLNVIFGSLFCCSLLVSTHLTWAKEAPQTQSAVSETPSNPVEIHKGTLYEIGSNRKKILFHSERSQELKGNQYFIHTRFLDPDGKEVLIEDFTMTADGKFQNLRIDQKQLGEILWADIQGDQVQFHITRQDKTETDDEKLSTRTVGGPQIVPLVQREWDHLMKGEDTSFRLAVLERKETVGFKLFKLDEKSSGDVVAFKMKPTSFVIAALVNPIIFSFNAKTKKLISVLGRTLPKIRKDNKWVDCDAEWIFE